MKPHILLIPLLIFIPLFATVAAAPPTLQTAISVYQDGFAPFDAETYDGTDFNGQDAAGDNDVVRVLDDIWYKIDGAINDGDATNATFEVTLDPGSVNAGQIWKEIPDDCIEGGSISTDGKTLTCNIGDQKEGTKITVFARATVIGTSQNDGTVNASVSLTSDTGSAVTNTSEDTLVTAAFKIDLIKKVSPDGNDGNGDALYTPSYNIDGPTGQNGALIEWHIVIQQQKGSEQVTGTTFDATITDSFSDDNPNNNSGGNSNGGLLYTWGTLDECENALADGTTVTCTQASPGGDITIDLTNIDTTPEANGELAHIILRHWVDEAEDIDSFSTATTDQITVTNTVTSSDINALTSTTGQDNYDGAGEPTPNNSWATVAAISSNGSWGSSVMFSGATTAAAGSGSVKNGNLQVTPGQVVPFQIHNVNKRPYDSEGFVCANIDTSAVEFVGLSNPLVPNLYYNHTDSHLGGNTGNRNAAYNPFIWNTLIDVTETKQRMEDPSLYPNNLGITIEYSSTPFTANTTSTGYEAQRDSRCEDDMDGDGNSDWFTDPASVPGGTSAVTKVRLTWNRVIADMLQVPLVQQTGIDSNVYAAAVFDVKVKDTVAPGTQIALYKQAKPNTDANSYQAQSASIDPLDADFSLRTTQADRVTVVSALMGIKKYVHNADGTLSKNIQSNASNIETFEIHPTTSGTSAGTITLTIDDDLPTGFSYVEGSASCTTGDTGTITSCEPANPSGNNLQWEITDVTVGETLPVITYQVLVDPLGATDSYSNDVTLSTDNTTIEGATAIAQKTDSAFITIPPRIAFSVNKTTDQDLYEVEEEFSMTLNYGPQGGGEYAAGEIIDIFPYNGDDLTANAAGGPTTGRDPGSDYTDTSTNTSLSLKEDPSASEGETFLYTTADPATISLDPCDITNQPAGHIPAPGDLCYAAYLHNGNALPDEGKGAAGATDWTASLDDNVTAVRIATPAFAEGDLRREIDLTFAPTGNLDGDQYCNSYGGRVPEITFNIISNDVCVTIVASSIGDTIYWDKDNNNTQDTDEPGIPNITVTLTLPDGSTRTTTTDENGNYLFENLPAGEYTITVDTDTLPTSMTNTEDPDGSSDSTSTYTLGTDEDNRDQDFGYHVPPASLGNYIWIDTDKDGIKDPDEEGLPNITVILTLPDGSTQETITDSNGQYLFTELLPGAYSVTFQKPEDYTVTYDYDGNKDTTSTYTLAPGENTLSQNFGLVPEEGEEVIMPTPNPNIPLCRNGEIGNSIFYDKNADGEEQKGYDDGIPGVVVEITWAGPDNEFGTDDDISGEDVTGNKNGTYQGKYQFTDLPEGRYRIEVDDDILNYLTQTADPTGTKMNLRATVTLGCDEKRNDLDFGFTQEDAVLAQTGGN